MNFVKKILQNQLFKISSLNSLSVLIKMAIGIITSKIIANFIGATGLALIANFRNFITIVESVATLGINGGVIKTVAEYKDDFKRLQQILYTVFMTLIIMAVLLSAVLFSFSNYLNTLIFGSNFQYSVVFKVLAFVIPFYSSAIFLLSVINGLGKFKHVIYTNIFGSIIGLIISFILVVRYQTFGALLSIVITPSLLFFITIYYINKEFPFTTIIKNNTYDRTIIKDLSSYSLMTFFSGVFGSFVFLSIRKNVIASIGIHEAGFLESVNRISNYYLMFFTTLIAVYYLPKLVQCKNNQETKSLFINYFRSTLPILFIGLFVIYLLRFYLIQILFSKEFLPAENLFFWQLTGDFFKVASMILGYQFIAKKMTLAFIVTETLSLVILYISSYLLVLQFGTRGVPMAYCFTYFIYFLVLVVNFRKILFYKVKLF